MGKRPHSEVEGNGEDKIVSSTVRISVGTYEHVLYGIDATIKQHDGNFETTFNPVYMFEAHTAQIKACAVGGRYLASGGVDEVLKLYDLKKRKDLGSLLSHDGSITAIKFPASGSHMLSSDENNRIIIWRCKDWTPQIQMTTRHGVVNDLSIHPSGKIALSVGRDRNVRLWNLVTGKKAAAFKLGKEEPFQVSWNRSGTQYAILFDKFIRIYDMSAISQCEFSAERSRFHALVWLTDDSIACTLESGVIQVLDVAMKTMKYELKGHKTRVKAISLQIVKPDNSEEERTVMISGSTDGEIKLWTFITDQWKEIGSHDCGGSRITCLATCDSSIEDLEDVVKRRISHEDGESDVDVKSEDVSDDDARLKSESDGEVEEFHGFA